MLRLQVDTQLHDVQMAQDFALCPLPRALSGEAALTDNVSFLLTVVFLHSYV